MERRFGEYGGGSGGFRGPQSSFAPVKVGDELDVTIDAVGGKGDGLAKKDGFVLFVPNTKEGDRVKIRVTKVLRKVGFAEVIGEGSAAPAPAPKKEAPADSENFGEESSEASSEESSDEEAPEPSEEVEEAAEEEYSDQEPQ